MPLANPSVGSTPFPRFYLLITVVVVVTVLRIAEDVMIPVALALLLAFLLSPVVVRLMRWRLPKSLAITLTAALAFGILAAAAWQISLQAVALLEELPRYESNLHRKISALKQPQATGALSRAFVTLEKMWSDLQAPAPAPAALAPARDASHAPAPVPVEVHAAAHSPFEVAREIIATLFKPLSTAGIVLVFVIAILFQREDLRSRFIRVISGGQLNVATEAVDDAAKRVSRYLLAQLLVNTFFGVAIGLGLYFIGIPHAALWGGLSTLLRFIPFLGPLIAVVFPLSLAVAVDPGWSMLFWTAGLYVAAELITNNLVEVLVYGTSTGISTLALLTAAVFWSWLWGVPGLFLSTPLTVCLLVLGQYVPGLKFLGVLLGSEPALTPSAEFYQRMLAMDHEAMFNAADTFVATRSLAEFYDEVFVPALLMSEVDRHQGVLAEVRQKFIFESSRELIDELAQREPATAVSGPPRRPPVLILPARDEADELVALMLAQLLRAAGQPATVASATESPEDRRDALAAAPHQTIFISALPPSTLTAATRAARRVKQLHPAARLLVGIWSSSAQLEKLRHRLDPAGADGVVTRLSEAVLLLTPAEAAAEKPALAPSLPSTLDAALPEHSTLKPTDALDSVIRELARSFDVPISLVSVLEVDREFWKPSTPGTPVPFAAPDHPVLDQVLVADTLRVVDDVAKDERLASHALLAKRGVRFLASAPLRTRAGHLVGNLCVLDTQPRTIDEAARQRLVSLAAQLMETLEPAPETSAA